MKPLEQIARAICKAESSHATFIEKAQAAINALIECDWPEYEDRRVVAVTKEGKDIIIDVEGHAQIVYADNFDIQQIAKAMLKQMRDEK